MAKPKEKPATVAANSFDLGVLDNGQVVIQFGGLIRQMAFTPEQAKGIGLGFIEMATRAESLSRLNGRIGTHDVKKRH